MEDNIKLFPNFGICCNKIGGSSYEFLCMRVWDVSKIIPAFD